MWTCCTLTLELKATTPRNRTMSGFFKVPQNYFGGKGCETGPTVYLKVLQEELQSSFCTLFFLFIGPAVICLSCCGDPAKYYIIYFMCYFVLFVHCGELNKIK